jgi:hypothetical protein
VQMVIPNSPYSHKYPLIEKNRRKSHATGPWNILCQSFVINRLFTTEQNNLPRPSRYKTTFPAQPAIFIYLKLKKIYSFWGHPTTMAEFGIPIAI